MSKLKTPYYAINIAVSGTGPFPLEMLGYMRCIPYSEADVVAMINTDSDPIKRIVRLVMFSTTMDLSSSYKEWERRGWSLIWSDK